jgi:hypothetical protein
VDLRGLLQSEMWKKSAVLGWVGFVVVLGRFAITGTDPGTGMVALVLGTLGISGFWQVGKRATHFRPEEEARAHAIRNGEIRD